MRLPSLRPKGEASRRSSRRAGWLAFALLAAGCGDRGFGVGVDVVESCASGVTALEITVVATPGAQTRNARIDTPPIFTGGHRRVVIVPPAGATAIDVNVRALAGAQVVASGGAQFFVVGHQLLEGTIVLGGCAGDGPLGDGGADLAPVVLKEIAVTPINPNVPIGNSIQLTATGTYSDNTVKDLTATATWSSNAPMTAMVGDSKGQKGLVTAGMTPGAVIVSAKQDGVTGVDAVAVIAATLSEIVVTPANPSVASGSTLQLIATGIFSDNSNQDISSTVVWSSGDMNVATVSNTPGSKGLASTAMPGKSTITAAQAGKMGTTDLTVTAATLTSIIVAPANPAIAKGSAQQLQATGVYSDNSTQDLTKLAAWSSSDPNVAKVDANGLAAGLGKGTTMIAATLSGKSGSTTLTVTDATLTSLAIAPPMAQIAQTTTQQFQAIGSYSDNTMQNLTSSVTWASSDMNVAPVSNAGGSQGLATGLNAGKARITATSGNQTAMAALTVTNAVLQSLTILPANPSINRGTAQQFKAIGNFSDMTMQDLTTQVTWTSTNTFVASVSNVGGSQGLAQGLNAGMSQIWAQRGGFFAATQLTVQGAKLLTITVKPIDQSYPVGTKQQYQAIGNYDDNSMQDLTLLCFWWSNNTLVATVDSQAMRGLVQVVGVGTTSINAWVNNAIGSTTITGM